MVLDRSALTLNEIIFFGEIYSTNTIIAALALLMFLGGCIVSVDKSFMLYSFNVL